MSNKGRMVKIVSDGTLPGTSVQLADGTIIPNVSSVDMYASTEDDEITATLTMTMTPVEAVVLLKECIVHYWKCPKCGKVWCSEYCRTCGLDLDDYEQAVRLTDFAAEEQDGVPA